MNDRFPLFTQNSIQTTQQDSLGLNAVLNYRMQDKVCPVVTYETYRPFYWLFIAWNYHEYQKFPPEERNWQSFDRDFCKRNDYYFVIANMLSQQTDTKRMAGTTKIPSLSNDKFSYNSETYLEQPFGGMQYYNSACEQLGITVQRNQDPFPILTNEIGIPLVESFVHAIENTAYYKNYMFSNSPVPKDVLIEFGNIANFRMELLSESKEQLRNVLFNPKFNKNMNLVYCSEFVKDFYKYYKNNPSESNMRSILYDRYTIGSEERTDLTDEIAAIASSWECIVGRQYFSYVLERYWYELINLLFEPLTIKQWITRYFENGDWGSFSPSDLLMDVINKRVDSIDDLDSLTKNNFSIINGVIILVSVAYRFMDRNDVPEYLMKAGDEASMSNLNSLISDYNNKTISDFLSRVLEELVLKRHLKVAFTRLSRSNPKDAYFYSMENGVCYRRQFAQRPGIGGLRLKNLISIMSDLDMLI